MTARTEVDIESVTDPLEDIAQHGRSRRRVVDDWLELFVTSLTGDDERYLETLDEYAEMDRIEPAQKFAEATGKTIALTQQTERDIVGMAYESLGQTGSWGQFFTPEPVSDLNAQLAGMGSGESVLDPACGSGRLLISAIRCGGGGGYYVGVDADEDCARMTAINLYLWGVNGAAIHGDSLKMDYYRVFDVQPVTCGKIQRIEDGDPDTWEEKLAATLEDESSASENTSSPEKTPSKHASVEREEERGMEAEERLTQLSLDSLDGEAD